MKRKLLCIVLVLSLSFVCAGCNVDRADLLYNYIGNRFAVVKDIGSLNYVVRDIETNNLYYAIDGYQGYSLCPYYDENGEIGKYEGGEK